MAIKHFEVGDLVKILDGRYEGEVARVTKANEEDVSLPTIKLEDSNREIQKSTHCLMSLSEKDFDDIKAVRIRAAGKKDKNNAASVLQLEQQRISGMLFKYGDLIMYDQNKTQGFVIEAQAHQVRVISEQGKISYVAHRQINKKITTDQRKQMSRDSLGFPIQVDNVVKVTNPNSPYYNQKGIIKNMTSKNVLFLWDHRYMQKSGGIFVDFAKNVTLRGHEFVKNEQGRQN